MNQRRKPKDPAKDSDPSDKTLILRPGASEEPTRALDARSTLALRGAEAERMKEATGAMPVQSKPSEEPTVALHISQVPAASTLKLPVGEPEAPSEPTAAESTQKLRAQDIAWVAGESPEGSEGEGSGMTAVDPTSRMRVSRSELSRIVKTKEASLQPPESRETAHLSLRREDSASTLEPEATAPGAADRTLILKPEIPTAPVSVLKEPNEPAAPAEATLILKPREEQGTVPIVKPHPGSEDTTTQMPLEAAPAANAEPEQGSASEEGTVPIHKPSLEPAWARTSPDANAPGADATLVLNRESDEGTVPLVKPVLEPASATMVMPQMEAKPVPEPAPATMMMPQMEAKPVPEPAPATMMMPQVEAKPVSEPAPAMMVMPQVEAKPVPEPAPATMMMPQMEAKPVPEPAPATMMMPQVEAKPVPEPAPATMMMPQVEAKLVPEPAPPTMVMPQVQPPIARPKAAGPGGTVPVMRTETPPKPDSAVPRPKADALPGGPAGPGGTVQLMRTEPVEKESAKPAPVGGTVPVMRIPAPATQLMPEQEAKAEAVVPTSTPSALSTRPITPEPFAPEPVAVGTQLVPVEELSRFAEIVAEAAPAVPTPIPPAASTAFSTRLVPQQPAAPVTAAPAAVRTVSGQLPAPVVSPVLAKSAWKLWAGIAGLTVIVIAGAVLWLRPDLLGMSAGTARRPVFGAGSDGPTRPVPAALKSAKDKADAGDAGSMRYLGTCYAHGLGVPRDVEEAKRWYRKAAEAGSQAAREELANLQRLEK